MGTAPLPQATSSSYVWDDLIDFARRRGANSASIPPADQLKIIRKVSSFAYTKYLWPFTLGTTALGEIQCVNGQQDYPLPDRLQRITRAWIYVPTVIVPGANSYGPYDDPSALAAATTALSVAYVNAQGNGGGTPAGIYYPPSGSLNVVKRLAPNLFMSAYTGIRAISQQPNSNLLRLDSATAVSSNQPYSLELEGQLVRPIVNAPTDPCWFPDDYVAIADEGILYELYRYANDQRAGVASMGAGGQIAYSGQLAVWMAALESAAAADRAGSVDSITPTESLGVDYSFNSGWPYA